VFGVLGEGGGAEVVRRVWLSRFNLENQGPNGHPGERPLSSRLAMRVRRGALTFWAS